MKMDKLTAALTLGLLAASILTGCANYKNVLPAPHSQPPSTSADPAPTSVTSSVSTAANAGSTGKPAPLQAGTNPDSITALVNKQHKLPADYKPSDLVDDPNLPFIFSGYDEKRLMRKEAAQALEKLFAAAKHDGIYLAGVSAYRSYATQKALFDSYVQQDGEKNALTYSALPGTSEHQTGLAIDVSGMDGKCAAADCFAGTKEANWLAKHASDYGFIVRYPQGKASITGYEYEPWHIRYVGTQISKEIAGRGITLEEYFNSVPVTK